ncbi:S49 family peptidase [Sansalvadorimonas verongulae]|uniref:S49 family peptidase n=1 Tax=Sansalvadorimonas verongulae TaxID=2172824 RepID=UPI0012BC949D|nr:S49 family peptidase [Sansalvadorimonas verongulae]MTI12639.1 S49 family peptidase [Sansalvadorimonas verongulae]
MKLTLLQTEVYNRSLMITEAKLATIMSVLSSREGADVELSDNEMVGPSESERLSSGGAVAVIPVFGSLSHRAMGLMALSGMTSYQELYTQIDQVMQDSRITEVVLDIDSHGGAASGVFDFADYVAECSKTKPFTAIVNEHAYSAAYLIASACNEIIIPRTGGVGSIGVIAKHEDRSEANQQQGRKVTAIYAGARKNDLSPDQPLSSDALNELQKMVNQDYEMFVDAVAGYRNMSVDSVRATEAGLYRGQDAIEAGLADRIMPARDALNMVIERATSNKKENPKGSGRRIGRRARAIATRS